MIHKMKGLLYKDSLKRINLRSLENVVTDAIAEVYKWFEGISRRDIESERYGQDSNNELKQDKYF